MTLLQALATNRPYKRYSWNSWLHAGYSGTFERADVEATDWEISEESVSVTRSQVKEALLMNPPSNSGNWNMSYVETLCKALGFKSE